MQWMTYAPLDTYGSALVILWYPRLTKSSLAYLQINV
jgi:hypothetical protein